MKKFLFIIAAAALMMTACKKDDAPVKISISCDELQEVPQPGMELTLHLKANGAWVANVGGSLDISVDPAQGNGDEEVVITVAESLEGDEAEGTVTFAPAKGNGKGKTITFKQEGLTSIEYGGRSYSVKKLADGNVWFVQNLQYVPQGKSVSSDLEAISNGIWYPVDAATKTLTNNADTVAKKGYLYNVEAALCVAAGTVTTENCTSYEGARGVCPEGWHIPTLDEIANLVGRVAVSKYDLNKTPGPITTAAYWNTEKKDATMATANEDGFNITPFDGFVSVSATATKGTVLNTMSYYISSAAKLNDSNEFNKQFFAIMANKTTGSCTGAAMNYRSGAPVRCIKDKK